MVKLSASDSQPPLGLQPQGGWNRLVVTYNFRSNTPQVLEVFK